MKYLLTILLAFTVLVSTAQIKLNIGLADKHIRTVYVMSYIDTTWHNIDTVYLSDQQNKRGLRTITSRFLTPEKREYQISATYVWDDRIRYWQFESCIIKPWENPIQLWYNNNRSISMNPNNYFH